MRRRRRRARLSVALVLAACGGGDAPDPAPPVSGGGDTARADVQRFTYPESKTVDVVEDYHGTAVADPYRWLEDLDADETQAWIRAQNEVTFGYLQTIEARSRINAHMTRLWNYERYSTPWEEGGRYFMFKNDGLQDQSVLYWSDRPDGELRVLLDPNTLSEDGTVAINGLSVSKDGKYLAYGLSASGSDWVEWHVREVETGKDTTDKLEWVKFSGASWDAKSKGFYYSRYDAPKPDGDKYEEVNYFQKLYYHRLGDDQSKDRLVYERKDEKEWQFDGRVTDDGRYLIIESGVGTDRRNRVLYQDLAKGKKAQAVELIMEFDAAYNFIDNDGPVFWFRTDLDAPRGRVIAVDVRKPQRDQWKEIIPQGDNALQGVNVLADRFVATYLQDAKTKVVIYGLSGKVEREVEFPGIGSAAGFGGERKDTETYYSFTSFTQPSTIYRYDMKSGTSEIFKAPTLGFDPDAYETQQVFYESKDGTKVPMFIVHKKGIELDGSHPTYLYGYGGFNISLTPRFSVPDLVWLEMGGVYAQPSLRGGGEYGEEWHAGGMKLNKQNVFDDFIAAGEHLIASGYTSKDKLAIGGRSNGGLLVGASLTQRPDLFAAALAGVGVMDMLRFHKFTIGWAWTTDYGSSENPAEFQALHAYSPYHNIEPGTAYPATLVYTADTDDRVVPSHSYKFAARLQAAHAGQDPVMIRIDTKAGHGAGKPTSKQIEEWADLWGFLVDNLDMQLPESFGR